MRRRKLLIEQIFFGGISVISSLVYSYIVFKFPLRLDSNIFLLTFSELVSKDMPWASIYWIFGLVSILLVVLISAIKFPKFELKEYEKVEGLKTILRLLKNKTLLIFFFGIFAFLKTKQGLSNLISKFLNIYHGYNPNTLGAQILAIFWVFQVIGSILGIFPQKILLIQSHSAN